MYNYHVDLLKLKIRMALTLNLLHHSRSGLMVQLDSTKMNLLVFNSNIWPDSVLYQA